MNKLVKTLLVAMLAVGILSGCGSKASDKKDMPKEDNKTEASQSESGKSEGTEEKKFVEKDGILVYTDTKNSPFDESGLEIQIKKGEKGSAKFIVTDKEGKATVDYYIFDYDKNHVEKHYYVSAMGTEFYYYYDLDKKALVKIEDGEHKDSTEKTKSSKRWDKAVASIDEEVKALEKYYEDQYKMTIKEAVVGK